MNEPLNTLNCKLSDLLSDVDIPSLPRNYAIFAHVGTGGGKSHFCMNTLYDITADSRSRILYLINRKNAYLQFQHLLQSNGHDDRITIMTYQSIEQVYLSGNQFDFSRYEYIIYDEYHRFATDSLVDIYSDIIVEHLLDTQCRRFFLSATPSGVDHYIQSVLAAHNVGYCVYSLPSSYEMADIHYFKTTKDIHNIIKDIIPTGQKAAVCFSSAKNAYQFHRTYTDSLFVCSESNKDYGDSIDIAQRQTMIVEEKFDQQFLFCTSCLDAGFNIIDDKVTYIITDISDPDQIVQWIGRKRIQSRYEPLHIYIRDVGCREIRAMIQQWENCIERVSFLKKEGNVAYISRFGRLRDFNTAKDLIYVDADVTGQLHLKVMEMQYQYFLHRIWRYRDILDSGLGYQAYIKKLFHCEKTAPQKDKSKTKRRFKFLQSQIGREIFVKDRPAFYDTLGYVDKNRHRIKNINHLNKKFQQDGLPFEIQKHQTRDLGKRWYTTVWTVVPNN